MPLCICTKVLEVRTENLKEGKSRQEMFAAQGAVVNSSMPQSAVSGFHSGSVLAAADDEAQVGDVGVHDGTRFIQQQHLLRKLGSLPSQSSSV